MTTDRNARRRAEYRASKALAPRKCQYCDNTVIKPQRICSSCREAYQARRNEASKARKRAAKAAMPPASCLVCGCEIQGNRKYCDAHRYAGASRGPRGERFVPSAGVKAIPMSPARKRTDAERMDAIVLNAYQRAEARGDRWEMEYIRNMPENSRLFAEVIN